MVERRRSARLRVDSVAFIVTKTGNPLACRIKDRSGDGARLIVDSVLGVPNQFQLVVQKTGECLSVTVVWRGPHEIGVDFTETRDIVAVVPRSIRHSPIDVLLGAGIGLHAPENEPERLLSGAACLPS